VTGSGSGCWHRARSPSRSEDSEPILRPSLCAAGVALTPLGSCSARCRRSESSPSLTSVTGTHTDLPPEASTRPSPQRDGGRLATPSRPDMATSRSRHTKWIGQPSSAITAIVGCRFFGRPPVATPLWTASGYPTHLFRLTSRCGCCDSRPAAPGHRPCGSLAEPRLPVHGCVGESHLCLLQTTFGPVVRVDLHFWDADFQLLTTYELPPVQRTG
jgi:hypothetical protein